MENQDRSIFPISKKMGQIYPLRALSRRISSTKASAASDPITAAKVIPVVFRLVTLAINPRPITGTRENRDRSIF